MIVRATWMLPFQPGYAAIALIPRLIAFVSVGMAVYQEGTFPIGVSLAPTALTRHCSVGSSLSFRVISTKFVVTFFAAMILAVSLSLSLLFIPGGRV